MKKELIKTKDKDKKYIRVKIYSKIDGYNELNLVFDKKVPIWSSDLTDLFNPSIFSENTRLKITIED
uniref:Uncharacterized protein n=1 Tax=viral metagenome TaxID=1070528 RepID=A0A6H1ZDU3_9ZZZZ